MFAIEAIVSIQEAIFEELRKAGIDRMTSKNLEIWDHRTRSWQRGGLV
jgi:hypothetical protein